ncbi:MAG: peroxidase [Planctomycetes bacterium]|nr:peroxidase [Planctomycetota bacterium]
MKSDYRQAELGPADRALCDHAVKLTLNPAGVSEADVDRLRSAGLSDAAISDATQVIGFFNYINRVADGLGVDLERGMPPPGAA